MSQRRTGEPIAPWQWTFVWTKLKLLTGTRLCRTFQVLWRSVSVQPERQMHMQTHQALAVPLSGQMIQHSVYREKNPLYAASATKPSLSLASWKSTGGNTLARDLTPVKCAVRPTSPCLAWLDTSTTNTLAFAHTLANSAAKLSLKAPPWRDTCFYTVMPNHTRAVNVMLRFLSSTFSRSTDSSTVGKLIVRRSTQRNGFCARNAEHASVRSRVWWATCTNTQGSSRMYAPSVGQPSQRKGPYVLTCVCTPMTGLTCVKAVGKGGYFPLLHTGEQQGLH